MARTLKQTKKEVSALPPSNYLGKIETEIKSNQSKLSMVLGALIILVVGILIYNYFNKNKPSLGPAQQTENSQEQQPQDVTPDKLPGKYTVKDEDTLFKIAEKYYQDGDKFNEIAKANNLADVNTIEKGQVLEIPKLAEQEAMITLTPSPTPQPTPSPTDSPEADLGTGGGNTTIWGPKIERDSYTVQEGDWLSTISARAYGDIFAYKKLAEVNSISNPDYIVPGQVLKIPR